MQMNCQSSETFYWNKALLTSDLLLLKTPTVPQYWFTLPGMTNEKEIKDRLKVKQIKI